MSLCKHYNYTCVHKRRVTMLLPDTSRIVVITSNNVFDISSSQVQSRTQLMPHVLLIQFVSYHAEVQVHARILFINSELQFA